MEAAAASLKLVLQLFGVRGPGELESAFAAMSKLRIEAVAIVDDPMLIAHARSAADMAVKQRLPSIGFIEMAEAGGLFAYGVNLPALARRAAVYVDKILKGTNPGDLPVEQPTKFELIVNLKTAKAIGLTIPQNLLFRADRVIE
jgi:putative ABC transport system substrate-binding protein